MSADHQELSDVDVTREALRITMSAFVQLQMASEHSSEADILKAYIQMRPFPPSQAASERYQNGACNGTTIKPNHVVPSQVLSHADVTRASVRIAMSVYSQLQLENIHLEDADILKKFVQMIPNASVDGEVPRVAMLDTMPALAQLQLESEHLMEADIFTKYIHMCPYVSPNSPSVQTVLKQFQRDDAGPKKLPKTTNKRHSAISIILVFVRTLLLDTPLALVFALYLGFVWTHRIHDLYFKKQLEYLEWTSDRAYEETTYYNRRCEAIDMTTHTPADLFVAQNATPEEAYAHQLKHGMTVFPGVLSERTATELRDYVVKRNRNLKAEEVIYVIEGENRFSFGLGTEEPSVVSAVKELATHPRLKPALEKILGPNPALIEMTAITAAYGAVHQHWHDDVVSRASVLQFGRAFGPSYSVFIQLQNTTKEMGATGACPGTHMCASGTMDDFCDEEGFQVVNEDEFWRLGDAMLMNMNIWHRGSAHVDPNGADRVMMIMTFVPKPRTRAESRQLSQGITFSLRWDMWGHTLNDLAKADTAMTQPWATLRALGLYKPKDADWGIDYITGSSHRMSNEDYGYKYEELETLIERGGLKFVPQFLHHTLSDDDGWHEYCLNTLINCENFAKTVHRGVIMVYVLIQGLVLVFSLILSDRKSSSFGRFFWALVRLSISHALVYGLYMAANNHVDNTEWAKDLIAGRLYSKPFGLEDDEYQGPTTLPHRDDVLIDTRYKSDYLALYRDYVSSGHPGNSEWNEVLDAMAPIYAGYSDGIFRNAVADYAVGAMLAESRRFLYQNPNSHWVWMSTEDAVTNAKRQLKINSHGMIKAIVSKIDHLISECKYGQLRYTSMAQIDTKPFLEEMKIKILGEEPFPESSTMIVRPGKSDKIGAANPFPFVFKLAKPMSKAKFARRPVILHPGTLPGEPRRGAWIKEGDYAEKRYQDPKTKIRHWYTGKITEIASQDVFQLVFNDGSEDTSRGDRLRPATPIRLGEELEYYVNGRYREASVQSVNDDGTYDVYVYDMDQVFDYVDRGWCRRPS